MKYIFAILVWLIPVMVFSQKPNKTLSDSIFQKGDIVRLPTVIYSGGCLCRVNPSLTGEDSLHAIAEFITKNSNYTFQIEAHSDSRGDEEGNKGITKFRAVSLQHYLLQNHQVDTARVSAIGLGEDYPIFKDEEILKCKSQINKDKLHSQNRRTQLRVTGKK